MKQLTPRYFFHAILLAGLLIFVFDRSNACAVNISIDATGPSGFSIFAIQMDGIKSMQIQIDYDASTLQNPKVSPTGILLSRSTIQANSASLGALQINVQTNGAESLLGSGFIATLDFNLVGEDWPGKIIEAKALVTEEDGKTFLMPIAVTNPPQQKIIRPENEDEEVVSVAAAEEQIPSGSAPDKIPSESAAAPPTPDIQAEASSVKEIWAAPVSETSAAVWSVEVEKGVLDGFTALPESRLLEGLLQLIAKGIGNDIAQEPPLALSDGATPVRVILRPSIDTKGPPTLIIKGANYISFEHQDAAWILEILPHAGKQDVRVSVLHNNVVREYPLTVAPPFETHMANRSEGAPWSRFDSFVKLVNYLVRSGSPLSPSP